MYPNLKQFIHADSGSKKAFLEHLFTKIDSHIQEQGKILLITLTKKSSEEVTNFLVEKGYKAYYLHSEIETMDRWNIIKKLRSGEIDILVGVNLLREGIDLPEVSLVAIIDADKEGFLRSTTSLIQIIGRAARNPKSEVILYADIMTESMLKSLRETHRRRNIQHSFNIKHNISPTKASSNIKDLESVKTDENLQDTIQTAQNKQAVKRLKRMTNKEKEIIQNNLKKQLDDAIKVRDFEKAVTIRDQLKELRELET